MKQRRKGELIGLGVGLLCIYVLLGAWLHFERGYDLLSTVRISISMTLMIAIVGVPAIALGRLVLFIRSKIKGSYIDDIQLSEEDLVQQILARNIIDRDTNIFTIGSIFSLIAFLLFIILVPYLPGSFYVFLFIAMMFFFWIFTVWRQWSALLEVGLQCPSCHKPLAEKVNWLRIPDHHCPYCGRLALVSTEYLVDAVNRLNSNDPEASPGEPNGNRTNDT
jgi:hypothetical protein